MGVREVCLWTMWRYLYHSTTYADPAFVKESYEMDLREISLCLEAKRLIECCQANGWAVESGRVCGFAVLPKRFYPPLAPLHINIGMDQSLARKITSVWTCFCYVVRLHVGTEGYFWGREEHLAVNEFLSSIIWAFFKQLKWKRTSAEGKQRFAVG